MPEAEIRLVVWDLDGTLCDSLRDIAEALNECLELLALPTHPVDRYRYMVGEGVPKLCRRAIGESHPHLLARLVELARARYRTRVTRHTRPYAGVPEAVAELARRGVAQGVLSNKPHELTRKVVGAFWDDHAFDAVQGYVEEELRKPDPHYLRAIAGQLGVPLAATAMVGDTPTDIETARRAGARAIGVAWGFRRSEELLAAGAERVVAAPAEVAALCGGA